jgi:predicted DNA-binding transcriptional regulator AlpA
LIAKLLSKSELVAFLGLSYATIHRMEQTDPTFPRRIQLAPRRVVWDLEAVLKFVESRTRGIGKAPACVSKRAA